MNKTVVNIINFKALYHILNEISSNLNFDIIHYNDESLFLNHLKSKNLDMKNSIILSNLDNKKLAENKEIEKKNIYYLDNLPIEIIKLIENINVKLIRKKYTNQSSLMVKNYTLNLNSRVITFNKINMKLTEKEIDIILFLSENKDPQKISKLQSKVWGHSSKLETHTVETHIYRLRKKMKDKFGDETFIQNLQKGYKII